MGAGGVATVWMAVPPGPADVDRAQPYRGLDGEQYDPRGVIFRRRLAVLMKVIPDLSIDALEKKRSEFPVYRVRTEPMAN